MEGLRLIDFLSAAAVLRNIIAFLNVDDMNTRWTLLQQLIVYNNKTTHRNLEIQHSPTLHMYKESAPMALTSFWALP